MSAPLADLRSKAAFAPNVARLPLRYLAGRMQDLWLTFDDGPHPRYTEMVLNVLEARRLRATFFVIGERARTCLSLVRRAHAAGHRIGNHTFTHPDVTRLSAAAVREEIERTEEVIGPYLGAQKLFRPPRGAQNATVNAVAAALGYRTVLWNVDTRDWNKAYQPMRWARRAIWRVRLWQGPVLLLHDDRADTAANLGAFLNSLARMRCIRIMPPDTL